MTFRLQGMRVAMTGWFLLFATAASGQALKEVQVRSAGEGARVVLSVDGVVEHKTFTLTNPDRVVVDLVGAKKAVKVDTHSVPGGPVQRVRVAQFANDPVSITRVVADLRVKSNFRVVAEDGRVVLVVEPKSASQSPVEERPERVARAEVMPKKSAPNDVSVNKVEDTVPAEVTSGQTKPSAAKQGYSLSDERDMDVSKSKAVERPRARPKGVPESIKPVVTRPKVTSPAKASAVVNDDRATSDKSPKRVLPAEKPGKSAGAAAVSGVSPVLGSKVVKRVPDPSREAVVEPEKKTEALPKSVAPYVERVPVEEVKPPEATQSALKVPATVHPPVSTSVGAQPVRPAVPSVVEQKSPHAKSLRNPRVKTYGGPQAQQGSRWYSQDYTEDTSPDPTLTLDETRDRRINLDVQGADIRTVLRTLSEYSGKNIIASKEVQGEVTATLKDTPWRSALIAVLKAHGFGYVEEQGIIRVGNMQRIRNEELEEAAAARKREELLPIETRVVRMQFAAAEELSKALKDMLTPRGRMQVDARTNALIISDIPANTAMLAEMAADLDSRTPQVEIVSKLVDVSANDSQDLGIQWNATNFMVGDALAGAGVDAGVAGAVGNLRVGTVQSWGQLNTILDALARNRKANVVSNPNITTVDNREAKILVGAKIPLIVADQAGNAITQLTTIGIQMRVTPHVNSDKTITLDLHPEVSELSSQATVQGGVIINTSEADTRVIVDDGETAIIGGLIRDVTSETNTGIPVLQDLPGLGWLFRNSNKSNDKRELIIFVTPRLIEPEMSIGVNPGR